jgi:hypothetical protein
MSSRLCTSVFQFEQEPVVVLDPRKIACNELPGLRIVPLPQAVRTVANESKNSRSDACGEAESKDLPSAEWRTPASKRSFDVFE